MRPKDAARMPVLTSATVYKLILSLPTVSEVFGILVQFSHMAAVPPLRKKKTLVYPKSKTISLQAWTFTEGSRRLRLSGLQFRLPGFKFRLPGFKFRLPGLKFRLPGFKLRLPGFKFRLPGFKTIGT